MLAGGENLWGRLAESDLFSQDTDEKLRDEVRLAVEKLSPIERKFIRGFYFEFKTYNQLSETLNRKVYKLDRIHRQALGKLRILLKDYVKERFGMKVEYQTSCPICNHP